MSFVTCSLYNNIYIWDENFWSMIIEATNILLMKIHIRKKILLVICLASYYSFTVAEFFFPVSPLYAQQVFSFISPLQTLTPI